ncbi:sensor histidine kinase [Microbispora sp. ATCC PTA-5024]|uniref:sensor histidine kinase n=1 Tax=Microbispora sp. ATCC PTA-5024 TaxID=316330 RepID=UPI00056C8E86|nr:histidine kinase [Microbispora sp. ATCC PTA-5024]
MPGLLRSMWNEPPPPHPPRRVWRDWALVGVLVPLAILEGVLRPDLPWRTVSTAVTAALVPMLLWRRTRPLPMVAICFVVTGLVPLLLGGGPLGNYTLAFLLLLPYALFRWGSGRDVVTGTALMLAAVCLSVTVDHATAGDVIGPFAVLFASTALGGAFRYRAGERMRELDRIKLLEREQLARDLHDTVAHHVSAMAVRAQAGLAMSASRPDSAVEALRVIEAEAARALDEMRAMVRVLRRNEPAELTPGRQIADLGELANDGRSGPPVDVEIAGDLDRLPPAVGAAVYRIAQESVTNAIRHARHATRIEVRVSAGERSVRLRVSDDGDGGLIRPAGAPGYGIAGMVERAGLLGGTCVAGPDPQRGWTVSAELPLTGGAS